MVPELGRELEAGRREGQSALLDQLAGLELLLATNPLLSDLQSRLAAAVTRLDRSADCRAGSLFRAGSRLSQFGSQAAIWADLYTGSVNNLAGYPLHHRYRRYNGKGRYLILPSRFVAAPARLPHETSAVQSEKQTKPLHFFQISHKIYSLFIYFSLKPCRF